MKKIDKKQDNLRQKDGQSGQSLVEMAIMLVVLVTLLGGVLDLGRAYYVYLSLQDAAGEGAVYGSIFPDRLGLTPETGCTEDFVNNCNDPNNVIYRSQNESPSGGMIDWSGTEVSVYLRGWSNTDGTIPDPSITAAGQTITVIMSYEYEVITPVIEVFTGDTITLEATAVNTIVGLSN